MLETDSLEVFEPTFKNNYYQHSNHNSLTIGSSDKGESSIFIGDNFLRGYTSDKSETFEHLILSSQRDFQIKKFEAWGFDWL